MGENVRTSCGARRKVAKLRGRADEEELLAQHVGAARLFKPVLGSMFPNAMYRVKHPLYYHLGGMLHHASEHMAQHVESHQHTNLLERVLCYERSLTAALWPAKKTAVKLEPPQQPLMKTECKKRMRKVVVYWTF